MRPLGPFGRPPRIAVAVSGGADSMALLRLAADWAAAAGGTVDALTVDHGLRPEAADEAARVAGWCAALGVPHATLRWTGARPASGLQERARRARYDLLTARCRAAGCAHLLVAHQREDQAETFLYRMSRGSGIDGLAAMPAVAPRDGVRIVRPLLNVPRARLRAVLAARGQDWVEDPSNLDRRYARVRIRGRLAGLSAGGLDAATIAGAAALFGGLRAAEERAAAAAAAGVVAIYPEGYADIDGAAFRALPGDVARRILAALVAAVGGGAYPVRRERAERAFAAAWRDGASGGRTLGNCVLDIRPAVVRLYREPRRAVEAIALGRPPDGSGNGTARIRWDGRFDLDIDRSAGLPAAGAEVRRLGERGWQSISGRVGSAVAAAIPGPARFSLPAIWSENAIVEVPHIGFAAAGIGQKIVRSAVFRPDRAAFGAPFWVA